jgi:hypothetical protein
MRRTVWVGLAALAGTIAFTASASGQTGGEAAPIYGVKLPPDYREWILISIASVGPPAEEAVHKTCFGCHAPARDRDFVFTRYSS